MDSSHGSESVAPAAPLRKDRRFNADISVRFVQKRLAQDDAFEERLKAIIVLFRLSRDGFQRRRICSSQFPAKRKRQQMPGESLSRNGVSRPGVRP